MTESVLHTCPRGIARNLTISSCVGFGPGFNSENTPFVLFLSSYQTQTTFSFLSAICSCAPSVSAEAIRISGLHAPFSDKDCFHEA